MSDVALSPPPVIKYQEFWIENPKTKVIQISREDLYRAAHDIGFCLYKKELHQIIGCVIFPRTERQFQDTIKDCIDPENPYYTNVCNAYESFMQKSCGYSISRLKELDSDVILKDTRQLCYKFFKNGFVEITENYIYFKKYNNVPDGKLILSNKIQPRDYADNSDSKYIQYLKKAVANCIDNPEYVQKIIGYLAHEYKDETTGYIIVLTEQVADPHDGGGSGKNLFCNLLSHTTTYTSINGEQAKYDDAFFQSWDGQKIVGVSDAPRNFPFTFLKEISTGTFIYKKLYKDRVEVPCSDGPKIVVQTQFSFEVSDGGLRRRIIPLEFTDFFTLQGGVDVYFGCHFPAGWNDQDWNGYDNFIANSIQVYLKGQLKISPTSLSETGWEKQFEQSYSKNLYEFISSHFEQWTEVGTEPEFTPGRVKSIDIRNQIKTFYVENDVQIKHQYSPRTIAAAIKEYSFHKEWSCTPNKQITLMNSNVKCYEFVKKVLKP